MLSALEGRLPSWREVDWRYVVAAVVLTGALLVSSLQLWPPGSAVPPMSTRPQMTFVCQESGEVFTGAARPTPCLHPATGQFTLVPAMYCAAENKWHAAPPPELLQSHQSAILCPRTRKPLSPVGSLPEGVIVLDTPEE